MASLPASSPYLASALPKLQSLLAGLLDQARRTDSDSLPSSSSSRADSGAAGSITHGQLCEGILRAVIWVAWSREDLRAEAGDILDGLLGDIAQMMNEGRSLSEWTQGPAPDL